MPHEFSVAEFSGPLDLLLQLIEHRELDITKISLAQVADQYLAIISAPHALELAQLADYLVIAARLVLIKSRLLLPRPESPEPEEETGDDLARQLREYKMFKASAAFLRERARMNLHAYARFAPPPRPTLTEWKIEGVSAADLMNALNNSLSLRPDLPQGTLTVPLAVSIDQKIHRIAELTKKRDRVRFSRLIQQAETRIEVIVTFLAVLEMIKRQLIRAQQEKLFGEIVLSRRDDAPAQEISREQLEADYTTD
ncbi:MAG: segregation/condensation protein A [Chloroflexi bacterium]|nr:segregation/condensation protein A [Chloroflexota bacterium]